MNYVAALYCTCILLFVLVHSLYNHVLSGIEESLGKMGIAMLCLLYCSRCGLTEVELLEMLGTLEDPTEHGNCKGLSLLSVCVCLC